MSKLYAKERNALPDEVFGLPKERKFPLTDEEHVRKAIQFFKFCPPGKRNVLAANINKRAKELGMTMKISQDNLFYRYAAKQTVSESSYEQYKIDRLVEVEVEEVQNAINEIDALVNLKLQNLLNGLFVEASLESLTVIEERLLQLMMDKELMLNMLKVLQRKEVSINPYALINNAMRRAYEIIFEFIEYNSSINLSNTQALYAFFEDIFFFLARSMDYRRDEEEVCKKFKILRNMIKTYNCNFYYIMRKLLEFGFEAYLIVNQLTPESDESGIDYRIAKITRIREITYDFFKELYAQTNRGVASLIEDNSGMFETLRSADMNMINYTNYLNNVRNDIKNEINAIILTGMMPIYGQTGELEFFSGIDLQNNYEAHSILNYLEGSIKEENIRRYNTNFTMKLDSYDILALTSLNKFERLYVGKDYMGNPVYYGICPRSLYLLLKNRNVCGEYYLLKLVEDGCSLQGERNLVCDVEGFDSSKKMKAIKISITPQEEEAPQSLTEGLYISADGDLKFRFKPKKTYMDEYAENHKILIANSKAKNYEAMKVNLAFLFALINHIEREVLYNKKYQGTDKFADAQKARMFAINDFKTYLKEVQRAEPGFDFTKYYEESDYGKLTINVKKDEITGLKKLFRTIMLG